VTFWLGSIAVCFGAALIGRSIALIQHTDAPATDQQVPVFVGLILVVGGLVVQIRSFV
jgi:hypothetical protein